MMKLSGYFVAAIYLVSASSSQAETISQNLTVKQGGFLTLDAIYALKEDCSPGPLPQLITKKMPAYGQLRAGFARTPIASDKNCPNVTARSLTISYFPYPNFSGDETIAANIVMPSGKEVEYKWNIKVTPVTQGKSGINPAPAKVTLNQ